MDSKQGAVTYRESYQMTSNSLQGEILDQNAVEPYGWKIGLKTNGDQYRENQKRLKQER